MSRYLLLLFSMAFALTSFGQTELYLNIGARYQPTDWKYMQEAFPGFDNREFYDYWPILQADLGLRKSFGHWFAETAISFRHTRQTHHIESLNFHGQIDPVFGSVQDPNDISASFSDEMSYAGVKSGGGYRLLSRSKKHALLIPLGLQLHVPVGSRFVSKIGESENKIPTYRDDEFDKGIYYGAYLRPTYEFALSQKRSNPWRFSVYAEGDLLIHHHSEVNPKILWGGGLGVSYRLESKY